jgi:spermidine synthase
LIYLLFFLSGISGLIYQVVWVRMFGNVFGNTIYSASIIVAVFMLGLGAGSYLVGAWADRRYAARPDSLLRAYGHFELIIAAMGLAIAAVLPHLGALSALLSSYSQEPSGWYALSAGSYLARAAIAAILLTPITLLMGGTLTLLIRHLVRQDLELGGWRIALLYGINTAGAALGCALTDFALVPAWGLWGTQMVAVALNAVAGVGAVFLSSVQRVRLKPDTTHKKKGKRRTDDDAPRVRLQPDREDVAGDRHQPAEGPAVIWTAIALAMTGFAALGMEILWFRHFSILLGGFRAVFSLLLTVILVGIGAGSLLGGVILRRTGQPAVWFMVGQGLFVAATLGGLVIADVSTIDAAVAALGGSSDISPETAASPWTELWFNARPMLLEVALPALLMGVSFPLANGVIQRAEQAVGRRAGVLYLSNTLGAVCGSIAAGFLLLPVLGLQQSATMLMIVAALASVPLYLGTIASRAMTGHGDTETRRDDVVSLRASVSPWPVTASLAIAFAAIGGWLLLPPGYVNSRAIGLPDNEKLIVVDEGLTEIVAVTDVAEGGRTLNTNGHPMSSTQPLSQRYMRALAHVPLLSMEAPETVLVIGFGVGNTTQAVALHPTVRRVDLADLSRDILAHAAYFRDGNRDVLNDPRVVVHINDGRQHLQMQAPGTYDLITLEPPPIAYAGVGALYSREFYALARSRLKRAGYLSQWLPAYQVPTTTTLSMIRAFVDVFPQSVLLSGAESDLILIGTDAPRIEIDPDRVAAALARAPAVATDLERIDLGNPYEIVGTFVGSARRLNDATIGVAPATDDRPLQEYGVRSLLNFGRVVPGAVVDLRGVGEWCPRCFIDGRPAPPVKELNTYLALLDVAYRASPAAVAQARSLAERGGRTILGSRYLGAIVPESAELHNVLGIAQASDGRMDEAIGEFARALALDPDNAAAHWHLGIALASANRRAEALNHLERSVQIDPGNSGSQRDLGLMLAFTGRLDEAAEHFQRALEIDPGLEDARRHLEAVQAQQRGGALREGGAARPARP